MLIYNWLTLKWNWLLLRYKWLIDAEIELINVEMQVVNAEIQMVITAKNFFFLCILIRSNKSKHWPRTEPQQLNHTVPYLYRVLHKDE